MIRGNRGSPGRLSDMYFWQPGNNDVSNGQREPDSLLTTLQSSTIALPIANALNMLPRQVLESLKFSSAFFPWRPSLCNLILSFLFKRIMCTFATLGCHYQIKPQFICVTSTVFADCIFHGLLVHIILQFIAVQSQILAGGLIRLLNSKALPEITCKDIPHPNVSTKAAERGTS